MQGTTDRQVDERIFAVCTSDAVVQVRIEQRGALQLDLVLRG